MYQYSQSLSQRDGYLHCEDVNVRDIHSQLKQDEISTPFFVFSQKQLEYNVNEYKEPLQREGIPHILCYAVKANYNPSIMQRLRDMGCSAVVVSGAELQLSLKLGFNPQELIFNGNGKRDWEIDLAVKSQCFINIDSTFDLRKVEAAAKAEGMKCNVLLRVNPDINANVHPFLATGMAQSKFGVDKSRWLTIMERIRKSSHVQLVGLHCHMGSTIDNTSVFRECFDVMLRLVRSMREQGFFSIRFINLGGGLGINYLQHAFRTREGAKNEQGCESSEYPSARDLIASIGAKIKSSGLTLILEPGRSLVANTCTLITSVLGCKSNADERYIVVDGAMTEVLRPVLYKAYHHIELAEPSLMPNHRHTSRAHVVGPVCECADFLGKDRWLSAPHEGCLLAVFDVGAYGASMSSNYNMRARPGEVLVSGNTWSLVRRPDTLNDMLRPYIMDDEHTDDSVHHG